MKKAYYYLFYKFYKMSEAAPSRWLSDWKAGVAIMVLELWSVMIITNYYNFFINRYFRMNLKILIAAVIVSCGIKWILFIPNYKWEKYVNEFDELPKSKNRLGSWLVFVIVLFVISNLIFSFYLISQVDWKLYK